MEQKDPLKTEQNEHNDHPVWYPCQWCPATFLTKHDLNSHLKAFGKSAHADTVRRLHEKVEGYSEDPATEVKNESEWRQSNRGEGFFCLAEKKDFEVKMILQQSDGRHWTRIPKDDLNEYRLSYKDGKILWISKRPKK